jgi:peptidyl-prolyl cis-trans isomerase B (cyclophilin B)
VVQTKKAKAGKSTARTKKATTSKPKVRMQTNFGDIVLDLDAEKAPITVANFLKYVSSGFYNGLIFHRVINGFMIQGGGMEPGMKQKPTHDPIENEAGNGLTNDAYTIAMARTSNPHSASSQFFINVANNGFLNHTVPSGQGWGYCVFGRVVQGMDVVDKIKGVETGNRGGHQDVPLEDVVISSAEVV